jgi:hypothetical protein
LPAPGIDVLPPHGQVALGDAGVGGQDEQHGVGVGQQVEGKLGLSADGIEARRVENHQALFEQRVGKLDDGVAPARDLQAALRIGANAVITACVDGKAQLFGLGQAGQPGFADLGEGLLQAFGRAGVKGADLPFLGVALEFGDAGVGLAALDGQQADFRLVALLPLQLGRAHGGAPGA